VLKEFSDIYEEAYPGLKAIVLTDNLRFHHNVGPLKYAMTKGVILVFLPPNTSQFTQPLDDLVFAILKSSLEDLALKLLRAYSSLNEKVSSLEVITAVTGLALEAALKKSHIVESFRRTSIFPFKPAEILAAAEANIGEPSPVEFKEYNPENPSTYLRKKMSQLMANKIAQNREIVEQVEATTTRVTVTAMYKTRYDTDSILRETRAEEIALRAKEEEKKKLSEEKEERKQAKEAKRKLREAELVIKTCRIEGCECVFKIKESKHWMWCESCEEYGICPEHWNAGLRAKGQKQMIDHEVNCGAPQPAKKRSKSE
jgi:hypothetical protein